MKSMNKCVVITGASRGIGLELVRKYVGLGGYDVYACCRSSAGQLKDISDVNNLNLSLDVNGKRILIYIDVRRY